MVNVKVMNGTPVAGPHLCKSCNWGQFVTGYRESDLFVVCTNTGPNRVVPFAVRDCTEYQDRNRPDWEQMEKLAINLTTTMRRNATPGFRGVGFATVPVNEDEEEHEGELEEVARS
jgi:hypothetical protein